MASTPLVPTSQDNLGFPPILTPTPQSILPTSTSPPTPSPTPITLTTFELYRAIVKSSITDLLQNHLDKQTLIGVFDHGTEVRVIRNDRDNSYVEVIVIKDGKRGWMHKNNLDIVPPTPIPTPTITPIPVSIQEQVKQVIEHWDEIHHQADRTLDISELDTVLTGNALQSQRRTIDTLRNNGCYWEFITLEKSKLLEWSEISSEEIDVKVRKHWDGKLYCGGILNEDESWNSLFVASYHLVYEGNQWLINQKLFLYELPVH